MLIQLHKHAVIQTRIFNYGFMNALTMGALSQTIAAMKPIL